MPKPKIPPIKGAHPLGGNIHVIGEDNIVPQQVQQLIIAMFQEYVLPEFVKFNTVLEALNKRVEKLELDRKVEHVLGKNELDLLRAVLIKEKK